MMRIIHGDCLEQLKTISDESVDALITDPPAGISFMGKSWDSDKGGRKEWITWMSEVMRECLRVMKPGAHSLVWAIPRTSHWTATALEDAGFEIRDVVTHLFGSGFPKSLNIEKAGAGKDWQGWGTALKPAAEFWILVRKPISEKTVAANVLKWGCGGLNIDESRIGTESTKHPLGKSECGRFPANLIFSCACPTDQHELECAVRMLDKQSGHLHGPGNKTIKDGGTDYGLFGNGIKRPPRIRPGVVCDSAGGGASRFFYCAKVSSSERGKDNKHPTVKAQKLMRYLCKLITPPGGIVLDPFMGSGSTGCAAIAEGFEFIGIERELEYLEIATKRVGANS